MKTLELKPVRDNPKAFEDVEREILKFLREQLYFPILKELTAPKKTITNSIEDLIDAVHKGRITFAQGVFSGTFDSSTSRELRKLGAKWSKGTYRIKYSDLPIDVKNAVAVSVSRFEKTAAKIDKRLAEMVPEQIAEKFSTEHIFDKTLYQTDKSIKETLQSITVSPTITDAGRKKIAKDYSDNLKRYVTDWTGEAIKKLRKDVQQSVFAGVRYETLTKTIQKSYGVSQSKAKFLARQETNLMLSAYKQARYKDAGVQQYKWKTVVGSSAHPVRDSHKKLDGKIFSWDDPPITDEKGNRNHPKEDFGCRCMAIPIVKF